MFNLFALSQDPTRRVLRLPLAADIQQTITSAFKQQEAEFAAYVQQEIGFDGKYKPDDGECLTIADYDDIDNIHSAIANPISVPEIIPTEGEFSQIKALFSGYAKGSSKVALLQSFDRRKIISSSGLSIFHSNNVYRKVDGVGISLDTKLSAILIDNTLKFFSFHNVKRVFDLSQYYVEATDKDLADFAAVETLHIEDMSSFLQIADSWIRRKVSLVSQSGILETFSADDLAKSASAFGIPFAFKEKDGKKVILMPQSKSEIKQLLRFLDEDYFHSVIQSIPHVTNSKRPA